MDESFPSTSDYVTKEIGVANELSLAAHSVNNLPNISGKIQQKRVPGRYSLSFWSKM